MWVKTCSNCYHKSFVSSFDLFMKLFCAMCVKDTIYTAKLHGIYPSSK